MLIPFGLENPPRQRAFVAAIFAALLLYQAVLIMFFPSLRLPASAFRRSDLLHPGFWADFGLGMFRASGPVQSFLLFLFWAVLGRGLEEKAGRTTIVSAFAIGCLVPYLAARLEFLAWEAGCWPGLGGMMVCLGLGYYFLWEAEVRFFYIFPTPFAVPLGFSSTAALFIMIFFHLVIVVTQIQFYSPRFGPVRPPGIAAGLWVLLLPIVATFCCFVVSRTMDSLRRQRQQAASVPA